MHTISLFLIIRRDYNTNYENWSNDTRRTYYYYSNTSVLVSILEIVWIALIKRLLIFISWSL